MAAAGAPLPMEPDGTHGEVSTGAEPRRVTRVTDGGHPVGFPFRIRSFDRFQRGETRSADPGFARIGAKRGAPGRRRFQEAAQRGDGGSDGAGREG